MKEVTVREAQHNLAKILREVEGGEEVVLLRRKSPVARIVPLEEPGLDGPVDWSGHGDRMAAIWENPLAEGTGGVLDDLRGER